MNTSNKNFINNFSDIEIVAFLRSISLDIAARVDFDYMAAIQEIRQQSSNISNFVEWSIPKNEISLDPSESAKISRELLNTLIKHPQFGPYLIERQDSFKYDELGADIIINIGMAASMMFLAVSTSLSISYDKQKGWKFSFEKDVVSINTIREIVKPLSTVATKIRCAVEETEINS